ncbi:DUF962 domain-containing protein [Hydrogenophaga sp. PAMC20947]|uniref:DUF962 domain-containing protein n=1 Tax=Hydrogenophaga sp. PAMC20947 TaxID=2565558 RepID=UPI00109DAA00|nr:DUF962 domain-containing protein [Hydrogenophaga sp. PAMC20947]QCB44920.1 DUF962 domain-containing protein [Hydrogenophaga sp. PAMC20947]
MNEATSETAAPSAQHFQTFAEFYPFYLGEHSDTNCRRLHFLGSSLGLVCLALVFYTGSLQYLAYGLLAGYACAWVGHFVFEKNKPASFKRPLYSFMGDWVMYKDMWLGNVKL